MTAGRIEIGAGAWLMLTVSAWTMDALLHPTGVSAWLPWIWTALYRGAAPGAVVLAVARALPISAYLIPVLAIPPSVGIAWVMTWRGDRDDLHRRGAEIVDAEDLRRLLGRRTRR